MIDNNNMDNNTQITNKFITSIKSWVTLDDNIRAIQKEIKKYKEEIKIIESEKKQYEQVVLDELDKIDEKVISISDGKIRKNIIKSQKPLKKEDIHKTILEITKDEKQTYDIIDKMMKSRQTIEKINLKRTKNKSNIISG